MKKFYREAKVSRQEGGYIIALDGKPVKTPDRKLLLCESETLAGHIAEEWQAQDKTILPDTMPVSQIVITAIDGKRPREEITKHILDFVDTDLVYYRSDVSPYKEKQEELWGRWTTWFEERFRVRLKTTFAIEPVSQEMKVLSSMGDYLKKLDDIKLILFEAIVDETSSPLLVMALFEGAASADDIYNAVFVDDMIRAEIYDEARYGAAPDQEKKRKTVRRNLDAAGKILSF